MMENQPKYASTVLRKNMGRRGKKQDNYSMDNKNPEADIGVQPEDQKSKSSQAIRMFYLFDNFRLKEKVFLSHPASYSSLLLGLEACTTTTQPLWLTSVALGIKGVCHHCLVCVAD